MAFTRNQQPADMAAEDIINPTPPSLFSTLVEDTQAAVLEFCGTTLFLLLGLGGIQAATGELAASTVVTTIDQVLYIALSMGFSLMISAWLFFRVTGSAFNPNISLALFLIGAIGPVRFVLYCIAQLLGGIAASGLILALTPGPLAFNTALGPHVNPAQGVFIEMFITSALVLAVLMLAAEKHRATPFAPIGIGLTLFASHLFAVFYTGASMNTARSFGPAVVTGFPYARHWVYWLGPFLGSLLGAGFYTVLKHYRYSRLNPGQDAVDDSKSPKDPLARFSRSDSPTTSRDGLNSSNFGTPRQDLSSKRMGSDGIRGYRGDSAATDPEKYRDRESNDRDTGLGLRTGTPTLNERERLDSIV